ncbi:hypothetical protein OG948_45945 (plasmid) [Embleya sp. NBC_00888]|uniref:hypothetical protein n=1 Tax=Embleya sp. NBC_00888 TaxID=2975960 RepID=UPI002F918F5C|nr:hypothetical protein OG948_45945 [Embleya sp. NBC_00888]
MAYRVESLSQPQSWIRNAKPHVQSAYADMIRSLASDPWRVGVGERSAPNTRRYAFCVEGEATFVIEDRCVTVTIVGIR